MKIPKSKRRKKSERQIMIKMLDKLASEIVRSRGKCELCGSTKLLACAHIFSRKNFSVRWDLDNLLCLCYRCHIHLAHHEPVRFTEMVKQKLGEKKYQQLGIRADTPVRNQDLKIIKMYLEQIKKQAH